MAGLASKAENAVTTLKRHTVGCPPSTEFIDTLVGRASHEGANHLGRVVSLGTGQFTIS